MYDLYKAFYNLNIRFRNLLVNSSLPIKINLSFISKSNFEHFNNDFILPNMHRITSFRVSNPMIYDLNISPTDMISKFLQLKRLLLDQIESIYMEKILLQLISLPFLTSLTIFTVDCIKNINALYLQIFNLPALKYCQLSLKEVPNVQINKFTSSFWIERGWFFAQQHNQPKYTDSTIFYSTNPYRRNTYTLCGQSEEKTCLNIRDNNLKSVRHVHIQNKKAMINYNYYFPNVIALTIDDDFTKSCDSFSTILGNIIPLKQLTKLIIECSQFSFREIIELLCFMPNIHTLIFLSMPKFKGKYHIIKPSEKFQLLSNINTITDMTIIGSLKFEENHLLINSCQHLQHLVINTTIDDLELDIRLLSNKYHCHTLHYCSLCILNATTYWAVKVKLLIQSEKLLNNYKLKLVGSNLYLWW
ncbi:unnamed protein product [Rotaria sp. Silwood1]|nr:unnamed protein product [Rotaria sp. Silwood1]CAF4878579.1 unnamed protein product [Rotaria sp. Silwood1]